jgi:hypothetical protein
LIGHRVSDATTEAVAEGVITGALRPAPVHAYSVAPASTSPDRWRKRRRE